jgi:uncharacterized membrane-anchored protein
MTASLKSHFNKPMKQLSQFALILLIAGCGILSAQEKKKELSEEEAIQLVKNLKWQTDTVQLAGDRATLKLASGYRFLDPTDTNKVMTQLWDNLAMSRLGMIFPDNSNPFNAKWAVIVQGFEEEGYVKDEDADKLDPDKLLKELQDNQKEANEERVRQGLNELEILGWAMKPAYDKEAKKLTWAIDLRSKGSERHSVNYFVRVLGRKGFLVLNLLGGAEQLPQIEAGMPTVLSMVNFNEGHRYADFNPKTDKVAAYGIAGLIAAGVGLKLAKLGLFALFFKKIGFFLLAAKKFVIAGIVAVSAFFKKLFGKKNPAPGQPQ